MTERARTNRLGAVGPATALALTLGWRRPSSHLAGRRQDRCATTVGATPEPPALVIKDGEIHLTLEDAVEIALRRNLDLSLQRYTPDPGPTRGRRRARGSSTRWPPSTSTSRSPPRRRPPSSPAPWSPDRQPQLHPRRPAAHPLRRRRLGSASPARGRRPTARSSSLNPNFQAAAQLPFTQPLLQGLRHARRPSATILQAPKSPATPTCQVFEEVVTGTMQNVENAYWELVDARDQLNVAKESLALAKELPAQPGAGRRRHPGAPRAGAERGDDRHPRRGDHPRPGAVGDAEDRLLQLLNLPSRAQDWIGGRSRTTEPEIDRLNRPRPGDPDGAGPAAGDPDAGADRGERRHRRQYFRDQKKPRLDLNLTYNAGSGGAGTWCRNPDTGEAEAHQHRPGATPSAT